MQYHAARGSWPPATCAARRAHRRSSCSTRISREGSSSECTQDRRPAATCFFFAGAAQPSPRIHPLRTPLPQNFLRRSSGLLRVHAELLRTPRSSSEVILTRFTLKSPHLHQISRLPRPIPRVIRILRAWREVSRGLYTPNPAHTPRKNMRKLLKSEVTRGA